MPRVTPPPGHPLGVGVIHGTTDGQSDPPPDHPLGVGVIHGTTDAQSDPPPAILWDQVSYMEPLMARVTPPPPAILWEWVSYMEPLMPRVTPLPGHPLGAGVIQLHGAGSAGMISEGRYNN